MEFIQSSSTFQYPIYSPQRKLKRIIVTTNTHLLKASGLIIVIRKKEQYNPTKKLKNKRRKCQTVCPFQKNYLYFWQKYSD